MLNYLSKIPDGVNIIIFLWAVVGLLLYFIDRKEKKDGLLFLYFAVIGLMIFWRVLIGIKTSRYAAGLILPFCVIAALFFYYAGRRRHLCVRLAIYVFMVITGCIIIKMNCTAFSKSHFCFLLAESFDFCEDNNDNVTFMTYSTHFTRIERLSHLTSKHIAKLEAEEANADIFNVNQADNGTTSDTIMNIPSGTLTDEIAVYSKLTPLVRIIANKKGSKQQMMYCLTPDNTCLPIFNNQIAPYPANLLKNGDFEILDSKEESYSKLKLHLNDSTFIDSPDDKIRTPRNAYFTASEALSSPPEVSVSDQFAIAGGHSARIKVQDGTASLLFEEHFSNGAYDCSVLIKGKQDSRILVYCDENRNDKWQQNKILSFTIPDSRIHQVKAKFSVDDLEEKDYFLLGISVEGDVYFDNFVLNKQEN